MRLVILLAVALPACSFVNEQVGHSSASACIRKECQYPNATDYSRCKSASRQRYQR